MVRQLAKLRERSNVNMADNFCKSVYKERLSFPDPLSKGSASRTTRYRLIRKRKLAEAETEERIVDSGSANGSRANELWMSASGDAGVGTGVDDGISDDDVAFQSVPTGEYHSEEEVDDFFVTVPEPDNRDDVR